MGASKWETQKVHGRDEVLHDIQKRTNSHSESIVQNVRSVMHDYEVDMYRLVISIGKHYGMEKAYEIMSETVAAKRLRWLEQVRPGLELNGNDIEKGIEVYSMYFKLTGENLLILEMTPERVIFKRNDFIDAIAYACEVLGLDVIEVNNKVYAKTMDLIFKGLGLKLKNTVLEYHDGWYNEMIEVIVGD